MDRSLFDEVMVPTYSPSRVVPVRGEGSRVWDQEGREYIDFAGGIAVNALGHAHPKLLAALGDQAQRVWHLSNAFANEPAMELAKRLCEATFAERVFFANSGGEANEAALKTARRFAAESRREIIAFEGAFHGRTLLTVTAGGKYTEGFGPLPAEINHVPFNDLDSASAISDRTCAVIVEPIQGESGVMPADKEFLFALREACDRHGALLVFDEVQTGVGRTGSLYAYQQLEVTPDILTSAKALGGGFPIGAMLTTERVAACMVVGTHGSTFGGNPLAAAVANAVLQEVNDPAFLEGVRDRHDRFVAGLGRIAKSSSVLEGTRGSGLLLGLVLSESWHGRSKQVVEAALGAGVMMLRAGPDVVRLAPALNIPEDDVEEGLRRLGASLETL